MQRLAVYKEKADELKKKIKSAMMYPMITIVIAFVCITVLMTMVLPMFGKMFDDFGGTLPALTQNVIALSDWFVANILTVFGSIIAVAIVRPPGLRRSYRSADCCPDTLHSTHTQASGTPHPTQHSARRYITAAATQTTAHGAQAHSRKQYAMA